MQSSAISPDTSTAIRRRKTPFRHEPTGRILVVQLGRLGDVVASRLVLHSLAAKFPTSAIEMVVSERFADVFEKGEPVVAVHRYPDSKPSRGLASVVGFILRLRRPRPELVVDVTGSPRSRWICFGCGARHRAGWGRRWIYQHGTEQARRRAFSHAVEMARLVASLGVEPRIELPKLQARPASPELERLLADFPIGGPVLLHPGAANPIRAWRGARFARLAEQLDVQGLPALLVAGPGERELAESLTRESKVRLPLFEPKGLHELMSLLAAARLFIGLDSGPMHLACALGTRTLALFGPNVPRRAAPLSGPISVVEVELPCRPCNQVLEECVLPEHNCMDRIEVETVVARAVALLSL